MLESISGSVDLSNIDPRDGQALARAVLDQTGEAGRVKNIFRPDGGSLKLFVENNTITVDTRSGFVLQETSRKRPLLYHMNFLHLSHAKRRWTCFADIYALALGLLAITGLFCLRAENGLGGRGAWLVGAGFIVPIFFGGSASDQETPVNPSIAPFPRDAYQHSGQRILR